MRRLHVNQFSDDRTMFWRVEPGQVRRDIDSLTSSGLQFNSSEVKAMSIRYNSYLRTISFPGRGDCTVAEYDLLGREISRREHSFELSDFLLNSDTRVIRIRTSDDSSISILTL